MNLTTLRHVANGSGGILYLMLFLLFVALTIAIERTWYLRRVLATGHRLMGRLDKVTTLEAPLLRDLADSCGALPQARVIEAVQGHNLEHDFERLPDTIEEAIMRELPRVDRHLWILDTIITLAPLLGLLGTIIGMFNAFQVLSDAGSAPTKVTGGVAEALLATATGLFIAIMGLVFFNGLNKRVEAIMQQMDALKMMLLNRMYPHYHVPAKPRHPTHDHGHDTVARIVRVGEV